MDFKIISGGQSGADLGGILFAQIYGLDHEINTHRGFKPIRGKIPNNVKVNYITDKMGVQGLRFRTEYNVKNSDITLILILKDLSKTKGSKLTARFCQNYNKPHIIILRNVAGLGETGLEEEFKCEYIDKNKDRKYIELSEILNYIYLTKGSTNKLIVNIAGERYWNEKKIVFILEKVFGEKLQKQAGNKEDSKEDKI